MAALPLACGAARLGDNLAALDAVDRLTPDVMNRIEKILGNAPK